MQGLTACCGGGRHWHNHGREQIPGQFQPLSAEFRQDKPMQSVNLCYKYTKPVFDRVENGSRKWRPKMAVENGSRKWQLKMAVEKGSGKWQSKWGAQIAVENGSRKWQSKMAVEKGSRKSQSKWAVENGSGKWQWKMAVEKGSRKPHYAELTWGGKRSRGIQPKPDAQAGRENPGSYRHMRQCAGHGRPNSKGKTRSGGEDSGAWPTITVSCPCPDLDCPGGGGGAGRANRNCIFVKGLLRPLVGGWGGNSASASLPVQSGKGVSSTRFLTFLTTRGPPFSGKKESPLKPMSFKTNCLRWLSPVMDLPFPNLKSKQKHPRSQSSQNYAIATML